MPTATQDRIECFRCDKKIDASDSYRGDGQDYCEECFESLFADCHRCGDTEDREDMQEIDGDLYCGYCYDIEMEDRDDEPTGEVHRDYSTADLPEFMSETKGSIITSKRIFSTEIECQYPSSRVLHEVSSNLSNAFGVDNDGSIDGLGVEFQTPKLQGKKGEEAIQTLCAELNKNDFTTDKSCGLHIHLDGAGLMPISQNQHAPKALKELMLFYLASEDVLMSFLPPSRRRNSYALPVRMNFHADEILKIKSRDEFEQMWYRESNVKAVNDRKSEKYDGTRYNGANFHSLLKDGHLEIRYHSGTTNARKILEWINLHQTIMDVCSSQINEREHTDWDNHVTRIVKTEINENIGQQALDMLTLPSLQEKTAMFYQMLKLPKKSQAYFTARQKLFSSTKTDNKEDMSLPVNEPVTCAG